GSPLIELDGTGLSNATGLFITAGGSTVRGLSIGRFDSGIGLSAGGNNLIQGNYIGVDATGTIARPNSSTGIFVSNSSNNLIGGTTAAARNVISGNGFTGV